MIRRHVPTQRFDRRSQRASINPNRETAVKPHKRRRFWRLFGVVVLVLAVIGAIGRAWLPRFARDYVNRTLDRSELYAGTIGELNIHLWRGAYSIHDVQISKRTGAVPVPFFAAQRVDFSLEWNALLHRRLVGRVLMVQPELNFVDAPSDDAKQTGGGEAWLQVLEDLFPFKINSAIIQKGSIHFRAYNRQVPVDVYLSEVSASIENLGNIRNQTTPLVATVEATALAMEQAKLEFKMTLDPFSYRPTFHMATRLLGLDLTKVNDLARSYGKFDFERGWLDLVIEADSKEGRVAGYVKPLFRNAKIFTLSEDIKDENVFEVFWQALVGAVTGVFKNWSRDQFGTVIPFTADATGTNPDILATIGNILRNAFVRAYLPRLEKGAQEVDGMQFQPPEISDPISPGETL
jgi:hypothetical protein